MGDAPISGAYTQDVEGYVLSVFTYYFASVCCVMGGLKIGSNIGLTPPEIYTGCSRYLSTNFKL